MALTKVTGHVVLPTTNIQFHNTKSTGIITATDSTQSTSVSTGALQIAGGAGIAKNLYVGGNLDVAGVLTYEDVTNIDAVGIITAQKGIHLGAGATVGQLSTVGVSSISSLKVRNLTSGRVVFTTTEGQLEASGNLTYNGNTFVVAGDVTTSGSTNAYKGVSAGSTAINLTFGSTSGTAPRLYLKGTANGQSDAGDTFLGTGTGGEQWFQSNTFTAFKVSADSTAIEALRIISDGKVGIGTASPSYQMHLIGNGIAVDRNAGDPYVALRTSGDTKVSLYGGASTGFRVFTKPSGGGSLVERFNIEPDGNVTIGKDGDSGGAPSAGYDELVIEGGNENIGMCFLSPAANNVTQQISFGDSNNNQTGRIIYNHAFDHMSFGVGGGTDNEHFRIKSDGNVGLGTTSPKTYSNQRSLTISGSSTARVDVVANGSGGGGIFGNASEVQLFSNSGIDLELNAASSKVIQFQIGGSPIAQLYSTGILNLGPSSNNDWINSRLKVRYDANAPALVSVRNENTGSSASSAFVVNASGNSWMFDCGSANKNSNAFTINVDATANSGQGHKKLHMTTGGDVYLGNSSALTFNNLGSDNKFLQIYGAGTSNKSGVLSLVGHTATNGTAVAGVWAVNENNANSGSGSNSQSRMIGALEWRIFTSDDNAGDDSGGYLRFLTKDEGAGMTEAMRLSGDNDGELLIGTTASGYKLNVQKDLNSGGNLAYFANSDSTYNQGLALSFDSNKDIEWSGGSGAGGMDWNMGTRGYKWRTNGGDRALLSQYGMFTLDSGSQSGNSKPGIELKSTGYTGNITRLYQDSPNATSVLETTERSLVIDLDSGNQTNGTFLQVDIDGSEQFRFDPGSIEFKTTKNNSFYGYHWMTNDTNLYMDFAEWKVNTDWRILEVFGFVNPNSSGSGAYTDPVHMYIYRGTGWNGSGLASYIYSTHVAPPARQAFPSGTGYSGNANISAVFTDGSSTIGNTTQTSTHYLRLLIPSPNASNAFLKRFRIIRRY